MWRCVIVLSPLTAPQNRTASASSVGAPRPKPPAYDTDIRHIHTKPRLVSLRLALPHSPAYCSLNKRSTPARLTREASLHQQVAHDI